MNLSIIIPTHRGDTRFVRAVQSSQWADAVIVVDDHSQNDWEKLRKQFQFTVEKLPEKISQDFSMIRNWALEKVKTEWVLFLDSDEFISSVLAKEIQRTIANHESPHGFYIKRQDIFLGKVMRYGEVGNLALLRLAKVNAGKWKGTVHEVWAIAGKVGQLSTPLLHEPHLSIAKFITKVAAYSKNVAEERSEKGVQFSFIESIVYPVGKFLMNYVVKLGFLDGWRGFIYAMVMSIHSSAVRIFLFEQKTQK